MPATTKAPIMVFFYGGSWQLPEAAHIAPLAGFYDPKRSPDVVEDMLAFIHGAGTMPGVHATH